MFNADFYPVTEAAFYKMLEGYDITGKTILEPSGGKGDLVALLYANGAKEVISCEKEPDLRTILATKCRVIASDFLTVTSEQISHIDFIFQNPPFSAGSEHILHAWNIAPAGCPVISLCNLNTIKNRYSKGRQELGAIIEANGYFEDIGQVFTEGQRETGVEVALIKIKKPGENYDQEFEGFFMDEDPAEQQSNGLMPYNVIRDIVQRYTEAIKIYDSQLETALKLNRVMGDVFSSYNRDARNETISIEIKQDQAPINRADFKKRLQKSGWLYIFDKLNMKKHTTQGLKQDINKFVEQQTKIPFTMKNIYRMLKVVIATTSQRMDKAILEVFDKITQHYDENRFNVEGWKTNSHYLVNKRFIAPYCVEVGYNGKISAGWHSGSTFDYLEDFLKALCYLTGENYDTFLNLSHTLEYKYKLKIGSRYIGNYSGVCNSIGTSEENAKKNNPGSEWVLEEAEWGQWINWAYFRVRPYKKGTLHIEFKDLDLWGKFNQKVAALKGYPLYEYKATKATKKAEEETAKHYRPNVSEERAPKMPTMHAEIIKAANQNVIQSLLF